MTKGTVIHVDEEARKRWEAAGKKPRRPGKLDCESLGTCKPKPTESVTDSSRENRETKDEKSGK
jgi:hypothetical protein